MQNGSKTVTVTRVQCNLTNEIGKGKKMTKATHTGTCQICGSHQKLPSGVLSKHGYTVDWGFFNGVCQGAGHAPFEKSTDAIEGVIESVKERLVLIKEVREDRLENRETLFVTMKLRTRAGTKHRTVELGADQVKINHYNSGLDSDYTESTIDGVWKVAHINTGNAMGKEIADYIQGANVEYVEQVTDRRIADMERYIVWQTERVANWVEQDLTLIDEDTRPVLHFERSRPVIVDGSIRIQSLSNKAACNRTEGFTAKSYRELLATGNYRTCKTCHAAFEKYEALREKLNAELKNN